MKRELVARKLESLGRCAFRLDAENRSPGAESQDIIALEVEQGVQICLDVASHIISPEGPASGSMSGKFDELGRLKIITPELALGMKQSLELRNIFLDNCRSINRDSLSAMVQACARDFSRFAESVRPPGEAAGG
jgi:uncharacterized protein YutE (UPF0331/DUF86 family)